MFGQQPFGGCFPGRPMGAAPPFGGGGGGKFGGGAGFKGGGPCFGKGRGTFEDEDRSRDWYCPMCKERNFVKRLECFKCRSPKPKDPDLVAAARPQLPPSGTTLNGMVKSFNRKGFGFLMVLGADFGQDIYYTRENLSPKLQTRDIPGQHVTFELHRYHDGKLTAYNIRPLGESKEDQFLAARKGAVGKGAPSSGRDDEDRTRDWICSACNERNFVKRFECFKCGKSRPGGLGEPGPDGDSAGGGGLGASAVDSAPSRGPLSRGLSPHAGSRAVREALAGRSGARSAGRSKARSRSRRSRSRHKRKEKKRNVSSSSGSDNEDSSRSSDSSGKRKRRKNKKGKKRSRSSSSSSKASVASSSKSSDCKMEEPSAPSSSGPIQRPQGGGDDPEVEAAKADALEQLMRLRNVEPKETRMHEWRALLRKWHPDKNPDRTEIATAVFQFLQKGKAIIDEK